MLSEVELIGVTPTEHSDGLEVRFEGQLIPQLTNSTYAIWNSGTTTLRGRDIVEMEPLRLELEGTGRILRAEIDASTRVVNRGSVALDDKSVRLGFDYLDPGDGFRVTVLHSGQPNELVSLGAVRGVPQGLLRHDPTKNFFFGVWIVLVTMLALLIPGFIWGLYLVLRDIYEVYNWPFLAITIAWMVIVIYFVYRNTNTNDEEKHTIKGMPDALSEGARFLVWPSTSSDLGSNPYGRD